MSKSTPGPWFFHEPLNANRRDFGVTAGEQYDPRKGARRRIAWVGNASHPNSDLQSEVRANAQLIAAAPDMLAALLPLDEHARERAVDAPEWSDTDTISIVVTVGQLRAVRAAIARAKGEE